MSSPEGCVVVAAGSRGIGRAVADRLRAEGRTVATGWRTGADVSDPEPVEQAYAQVREGFGPVPMPVDNGGERADVRATRDVPGRLGGASRKENPDLCIFSRPSCS